MDLFSAFGSIDYQSVRANTPAEMAIKRLNGIGEVLSALDISATQTESDMAHALWALDTADKCIGMILAEFRAERSADVVRKAKSLIGLIEQARSAISGDGAGGKTLTRTRAVSA
ncbi:hypothetical protein [Bradyrhizobium sp. USDA 4486]